MKVLMATDGSVHANTAILTAKRLLRRRGLSVDILCVTPQLALEASIAGAGRKRGQVQESYREHVSKPTSRILEAAHRLLEDAPIRVNTLAKFGSPADQLVALAPEYDLTVVGSYGKHERKQPGLGPISGQVMQLADANVMVGRELVNEDGYRVLVALDSSEASFKALRALGSFFDVSTLDVTLMHVVELPWAHIGLENWAVTEEEVSELEDYQAQLEHELRQDAQTVIDRGLHQLEQWHVPASAIIEEGDPALELISHAEEGGYDLVVAGATGASDVKHARIGSVSMKLAWNAPCSVLVVRK